MSIKQLAQEVTRLLVHRPKHSHNCFHFKRVAKNTRLLWKDYPQLTRELKHDSLVLAWTHDLDDPKYKHKEEPYLDSVLPKYLLHLKPTMAKQIIKRASWTNEMKQIKETQSRDWEKVLGEYVLLRNILSDADKLDAIHDQGLERCAAYVMEKHPEWKETDMQVFQCVHQHAHDKLLKIPEFLHSPTAKKMGYSFQEQMAQKLEYFYPTLEEKKLHLIAQGFHIQVGEPFLHLSMLNPQALSVNLAFVLDPNHSVASQIKKEMFGMFLSLMYYYAEEQKKKVLVHIHQLPEVGNGIVDVLQKSWDQLKFQSHINYMTDTATFNYTKIPAYLSTDVLLSFSWCVGIDKSLLPGSWVIPVSFVPIKDNVIRICDSYQVKNDLMNLPPNKCYNKQVMDFIDTPFSNVNMKKVALFQCVCTWNPSGTHSLKFW